MMQYVSNYLFLITPIAAGIAFLASLTIFVRPAMEKYLKYFSIFLFVNWLMETGAAWLGYRAINNLFASNIQTILVISYILFLLHQVVHRRSSKKALAYIAGLYPVLALINIFFIQRNTFHTITYSLGSLLIVAGCIYYFLELFQAPKSVALGRQPAFWICSGLLFYYACTFPIYGFTKLMEALPVVIVENLLFILVLLNIFLYLSFTIAFLCRFKPRTSMSSF